ncbi:MAG: hypothetical protein K2O02_06805 [Lachnospiraceae bacterium]|nr:hypothetical protein [Lachnospiraceae bacterium]
MPGEQEKKEYTIPRGPAATAAKNRHRDKNYDRSELILPKGMKDVVKGVAKQKGKTFNNYVWEAVKEKVESDTGEILEWEKKTK